MIEIRKTELFAKWLDNLRDIKAKARVLVRIERLAMGNAGGRQTGDIKAAIRLAQNL